MVLSMVQAVELVRLGASGQPIKGMAELHDQHSCFQI